MRRKTKLMMRYGGYKYVNCSNRSALCNGCGTCVDSCPEDVIRLDSVPAGREELPPCTVACPAGVNIRRYMHMLKLRMIDEAAAILRESLPIPAVTGRVCPTLANPNAPEKRWTRP